MMPPDLARSSLVRQEGCLPVGVARLIPRRIMCFWGTPCMHCTARQQVGIMASPQCTYASSQIVSRWDKRLLKKGDRCVWRRRKGSEKMMNLGFFSSLLFAQSCVSFPRVGLLSGRVWAVVIRATVECSTYVGTHVMLSPFTAPMRRCALKFMQGECSAVLNTMSMGALKCFFFACQKKKNQCRKKNCRLDLLR